MAYGTRIVAGVSTRAGAGDVEGVPVLPGLRGGCCGDRQPGVAGDGSPSGALAAVEDALSAGIRLIVTVAEGIPIHEALRIGSMVKQAGATWVGPSTPGLAVPGEMKLGFLPDVSLRPGPLAIMAKSGTLSYETGYRLAALGIGQSLWVGVGGDPVKGVRFADLLPMFVRHERTRGIILIGEVGGSEEEEFADALRQANISKPVYALVAGRGAKEGVSMGHAGALVFGDVGTFESKKARLQAAGARVFASIDDLVAACRQDHTAK